MQQPSASTISTGFNAISMESGTPGRKIYVAFNARDKHVAKAIQTNISPNMFVTKNNSRILRNSLQLVSVILKDEFITHFDIDEADRLNNIRAQVAPVLDQYDFYSIDALGDLDNAGNGIIEGYVDNSKTIREYFKVLERYKYKDFSVFDYVHLVRDVQNILLSYVPEIQDWTFEVLHIRKGIAEFNDVHRDFSNFMECVWISIISLATQPHLIGRRMLSVPQQFVIKYLYTRFTNFNDLCALVCNTCKSHRWADNANAKEISQFMDAGNAEMKNVKFSDIHKKIIATILNLTIHEMTLRDDMKLSNDFSSIALSYKNTYNSLDTFYLNSEVYPAPSIHTPPVYFKIRKSYSYLASPGFSKIQHGFFIAL